MKRLLSTVFVSVIVIWIVPSVAQIIGLLDMHKVFQTSSQIRDINTRLEKQFSLQRKQMVELTQSLQCNLRNLRRNEAVMSREEISSLREKIQRDENRLRQQQQQFQQQLLVAQNKEMIDFMSEISDAVKKIAAKENLDFVLPKDTVLYTKESKDITSNVISELKYK